MNPPSLGKLVAVHGVSPAYVQRAAVVAALSFVFFVAMMAIFYIRAQFGYFLLATGFLVVFLFTVVGLLMLRRNVVEVFDRGIAHKRFIAEWGDIAALERHSDGSLTITGIGGERIPLPKTLNAVDKLEAHIRRYISR